MKFDEIVVVGCGVIGLTSAIVLQRRLGIPVRIVARDLPPETTSNVAAAVWMPFQVAPEKEVLRWGSMTREVLEQQMSEPASGVFPIDLLDLFPGPDQLPWWIESVPNHRLARAEELPEGYRYGVIAVVPMIDTTMYMPWLIRQFLGDGGAIEKREIADLAGLSFPASNRQTLLVNCTGLGARSLCGDEEVFPIRGQIARLDWKGYPRALTDDHHPAGVAYLLPRKNELIAGGTTGRGEWETRVDETTAGEILERVRKLDPEIAGARVIEHVVGLRPGRTGVRLEKEVVGDGVTIIHNYGHGGGGFTLAWGCASDVADLATGCLAGGPGGVGGPERPVFSG